MTAAVIGALRVNLGLDSAQFERGLTRAGQKARRAGEDFGVNMKASVAAGVTALSAAAIVATAELARLGAAFDDSMRKLAAAADVGAESLGAVKSQMRQIGLATGEGASGAARVAKELMKAGVSMKDATGEATRQVILMAQANEAGLAESVDIASGAMLLFGKRGDQMGEVAQSVTAFVSGTRREVVDFAGALGMGGQAAATAGVSLEEFTGALVASVNAFSSGSDQGTAFKTFMQRLTPSSVEAAAAMEELGFNAYDAQGRMKPLQQIVDELAAGMAKLSTEQDRNKARIAIFGTDAERMAAALMNNRNTMRQVTEETIRNTDVASKAAMANSGLEGSTKRLKSAFEELGVTIGEAGLTQAQITFVDFLTTSISGVANLEGNIWKLVEAHRALANELAKKIGGGDNVFGLPTVDVGASLPGFSGPKGMSDAEMARTSWGQAIAAQLRGAGFGPKGAGGGGKPPPGGGKGVTLGSGDFVGSYDALPNKYDMWSKADDYRGAMQEVDELSASIAKNTADIEASTTMAADLANADLRPSFESVAESIADAAQGLSGMLGSIKRGDWLGALAQGIKLIEMIGGLGSGDGKGGVFKSLGKLMGFANGGSFEVAGASGVDKNLVAFRATAGERVTITKPGQGGGGSFVYAPQIDARGVDPGQVSRLEAILQAQAAGFRDNVIGVVRDGFQRRAFRGY